MNDRPIRHRPGSMAAVVCIVAATAGLFAYTGGWFSPKKLTPARFVDTFEKLNGEHAGFRRNHAKGLGASGYFESNGEGVSISKASVFAPGRVPVIGRFAIGGGIPDIADDLHTVRSMALEINLPKGQQWRIGINNIPVFPAATPQDFYGLMLATAPDPATGKPDPAKVGPFISIHPQTAKALATMRSAPPSSGFADDTFNSLNTFRFINAAGDSIPVRWAMVPAQKMSVAPATEAAVAGKNFLFDALIAQVHDHPLQWKLMVTLAAPQDPTNDPTVAWPPDRKQIEVGTLTINHLESEETSPARDINFDPLVLPDGIAGSDDPILSARSAAYSQSFQRRASETKSPSAVTPTEAGK